jgi:hypothetical protein
VEYPRDLLPLWQNYALDAVLSGMTTTERLIPLTRYRERQFQMKAVLEESFNLSFRIPNFSEQEQRVLANLIWYQICEGELEWAYDTAKYFSQQSGQQPVSGTRKSDRDPVAELARLIGDIEDRDLRMRPTGSKQSPEDASKNHSDRLTSRVAGIEKLYRDVEQRRETYRSLAGKLDIGNREDLAFELRLTATAWTEVDRADRAVEFGDRSDLHVKHILVAYAFRRARLTDLLAHYKANLARATPSFPLHFVYQAQNLYEGEQRFRGMEKIYPLRNTIAERLMESANFPMTADSGSVAVIARSTLAQFEMEASSVQYLDEIVQAALRALEQRDRKTAIALLEAALLDMPDSDPNRSIAEQYYQALTGNWRPK